MNTFESILNLATPDLKIMAASRTVIHNQTAGLKLDFLPVMKEKLQPLLRALTKGDEVFRQELQNLAVGFESPELAKLELKREQFQTDDRVPPELLKHALGLLDGEHTRITGTLAETLRKSAKAMAESVDDLMQINLETKGSALRDTLNTQIDTLTRYSEGLQAQMRTIADDQRLLDATIKTFEDFSLIDIFKEALPTTEELSTISLPSPELELARAGLARLNKLLGHLGRALKYQDLINERDRLRASYNECLAQVREYETDMRKLVRDLNEIDGLAHIHQSKTAWAMEAMKAIDALRAFQNAHMRPGAPLLSSQQARQLVGYIKSFYGIERQV